MSTQGQDEGQTGLTQQVDPWIGITNALHLSLGLANVPEYSGSTDEDVEEFLKKFARATTALSSEQKCLVLRKALVGDAEIFLKNYLKPYLLLGDWKSTKEELRKRFSHIDPQLSYRAKLKEMVFEPSKKNLLGYVDRYANLYKKIHSESKDSELIQDISLSLGKAIILKLNQLSADWRSIKNFEEFRTLVLRLERDIMALETDTLNETANDLASKVNVLVTSALQEPIKGIQDILSQISSQKIKEKKQVEELAAVKYSRYPNNKEDRPQQDTKRRERDWEEAYEGYDFDRFGRKSVKTRFALNRLKELKQKYEENHGRIFGTCYICDGLHFRRHCPLENPDLNDNRNRQ